MPFDRFDVATTNGSAERFEGADRRRVVGDATKKRNEHPSRVVRLDPVLFKEQRPSGKESGGAIRHERSCRMVERERKIGVLARDHPDPLSERTRQPDG